MNSSQNCSSCAAELPADSPGGHCLPCLLQLALAADSPDALAPVADIAPPLHPGQRVGRYRVLEPIGAGGCGAVFLAEQEEPVRRQVALKVIKPGLDTRSVIARFAAERQALALLDHPNIARVYDAGATEAGRPFFVMELVRGARITAYCDEHKLSHHQRLELFVQVCHAVQHAHEQGIIHRDLKPSNILVTEPDPGAPGAPKIIDFGIAKSLTQPLTEQTSLTAWQQFLGTPAYMSPEQAGRDELDVDPRSDIYSIGVLLYELLTGLTPFPSDAFHDSAPDEILRFIRETEPARPSTRLMQLAAPELNELAAARGIEPGQLPRCLRGELDCVVMKCLEKDPARRYQTAGELAADLLRYLRHEPVGARPPTNVYRLQKLVRRNRLAFAATALVTAVLVAGSGISAWSVTRERRLHRSESWAEMLQRDFHLQARAANERALQEARERRRTTQSCVRTLNNQAVLLARDRNFTGAEAISREALGLERKAMGEENPDTAAALGNVANFLAAQDKFAEAESLDREALAIDLDFVYYTRRVIPTRIENLAKDLAAQGKQFEAGLRFHEAAALRASWGMKNTDT